MAVIGKLTPNAYDIEDSEYLDCIDGQFEIIGQIVINPEHFRAGSSVRSNNYLVRLPEARSEAAYSTELYWGTQTVKDGRGRFDSYIDEDLFQYGDNDKNRMRGRVHLWIVSDAIEVISGLSNKHHRNKLDLI